MSSIHKQQRRRCWYCAYTDNNGKRHLKSTKTTDKKEAKRICNRIQDTVDRARSLVISEEKARTIIESAVSEIMDAQGNPIESTTVSEFFLDWLESVRMESQKSTYVRYHGIIHNFLQWFGNSAKRRLSTLRTL